MNAVTSFAIKPFVKEVAVWISDYFFWNSPSIGNNVWQTLCLINMKILLCLCFERVFNKAIPLALVGDEMIVAITRHSSQTSLEAVC